MTVLNSAFFFILGPSQKMVDETWETNWTKLAWLCLLEDVKLQMSLSLPLWSKVRYYCAREKVAKNTYDTWTWNSGCGFFLKVIEEMVKDFFKVLTCGKPSYCKNWKTCVSHGNNATLEALDKMNGWIWQMLAINTLESFFWRTIYIE